MWAIQNHADTRLILKPWKAKLVKAGGSDHNIVFPDGDVAHITPFRCAFLRENSDISKGKIHAGPPLVPTKAQNERIRSRSQRKCALVGEIYDDQATRHVEQRGQRGPPADCCVNQEYFLADPTDLSATSVLQEEISMPSAGQTPGCPANVSNIEQVLSPNRSSSQSISPSCTTAIQREDVDARKQS